MEKKTLLRRLKVFAGLSNKEKRPQTKFVRGLFLS